MSKDVTVVLAAGQGTRMRSRLPKVLHALAGRPMLIRVLDTLAEAGFDSPLVVVGYEEELVRQAVGDRCQYVTQAEQAGTGDAVRVALRELPESVERLVVAHGDEPMLTAADYQAMLELQTSNGADIVLLTTTSEDTRNFGRVIRDASGNPVALKQDDTLSADEQALTEVNLGAYVFNVRFLRTYLPRLRPHPPKGEYYFTDLVEMAAQDGRKVAAVEAEGGKALMGINDLVQLEEATQLIYRRTNERLMRSGVTIVSSATTFIDDNVTIEPDTVVHPCSFVSGNSRIGAESRIGPNARILSSQLGERCSVVASTVTESIIGSDVAIGPHAHIRAGSRIEDGAEIGSSSEVKRSRIGKRSKMHHFGYVGDADVGEDVNVGAGAITVNFDGVNKHRTIIGDGASVGSDTMLVAPVTVGAGSVTGAGSVVTRDVPPGKLAVGMPARAIKSVRRERGEEGKS